MPASRKRARKVVGKKVPRAKAVDSTPTSTPKNKQTYSITDIMKLEGVSRVTVYSWIETGKIQANKNDFGYWEVPSATYKRPRTTKNPG